MADRTQPSPAAPRPPRITRRRVALAAVAAVLIGAVGATVVIRSAPQKKTPCQAATEIVGRIKEAGPGPVAHLEAFGNGYSPMLRGLVIGQYEDVTGAASPELATHLRTVADDLGRLGAAGSAPADEFTTGQTGRHMDELLASCASE